MFNARPALVIVGLVLLALAAAMLLPAAIDGAGGLPDGMSFLASSVLVGLLGAMLVGAFRGRRVLRLTLRQLFLATTLAWFAAGLAASLPLAQSGLHLAYPDALFEAVSGVTATGATALRGLDRLPPGVLMWRAQLQWLGGIGVLITGVVVLPILGVGGMGVFRIEGQEETRRGGGEAAPRVARVMGSLLAVYVIFTAALAGLLWAAGMPPYTALLHAMSTVSCGGFSTDDRSLAAWPQPDVQWVVLLGMVLGGVPYQIYPQLASGQWRRVLANRQVRWYLGLFGAGSGAICLWFWFHDRMIPLVALRHGAFAVASTMTGTGYASIDWGSWGGFPAVVLFLLAFVGGSAGSLAGGFKVFRLRLLVGQMRVQMVRLLRPHAVLRTLPEPVGEAVLGYLFVFALAFAATSLLLGVAGLSFLPAVSGAISALVNLGPGIVPAIGPMTGFAAQPASVKLILAAAMLFGRVELFTALVLFMPSFWRP